MAATLAKCGTLFSHLPGSDLPKPLRISEPPHLCEEANSAGFRVSRGLRWRAQAGPTVKVTAPLPSSPQVSPGLGGVLIPPVACEFPLCLRQIISPWVPIPHLPCVMTPEIPSNFSGFSGKL